MPIQKPIPGPSGFATLKTLFNYYRAPLQTFKNLIETYGDIFQIKFWKYHIIHLTNPDAIQSALINPNFEISATFSPAEPLVGKGLTSNTGDDWLRQRRLLQPAFHHEKIAQYLDALVDETEKMLSRWESFAKEQSSFDLVEELTALNHAQLVRLLFGTQLTSENQKILEALQFARTYTNQRVAALLSPPQAWPTPANRRFRQAVTLLNEYTYHLIHRARETPPEHLDVLSYLIHTLEKSSNKGMTDTQIHDELLTLFFAAYEDAANALSWTFYEITRYPEIFQRLQAEVDQQVSGKIDLQSLQKLPTVSQVIDETLRLYPPTWSLLRDVLHSDTIEEFSLPKGAIILINIFHLQRHSTHWKNPDQFEPSRFSPENSADFPKNAYIPFGSGARKCIGYSLALAQMKTTLAMVTQRFQVIPQPGHVVQIETDSTLRMKNGFPVTVISR
ncbi:MAG: cytochrome P450 [Anaerolineae bacterium]|nr:cytochrome P450 [Anaerolineae bacterium]